MLELRRCPDPAGLLGLKGRYSSVSAKVLSVSWRNRVQGMPLARSRMHERDIAIQVREACCEHVRANTPWFLKVETRTLAIQELAQAFLLTVLLEPSRHCLPRRDSRALPCFEAVNGNVQGAQLLPHSQDKTCLVVRHGQQYDKAALQPRLNPTAKRLKETPRRSPPPFPLYLRA